MALTDLIGIAPVNHLSYTARMLDTMACRIEDAMGISLGTPSLVQNYSSMRPGEKPKRVYVTMQFGTPHMFTLSTYEKDGQWELYYSTVPTNTENKGTELTGIFDPVGVAALYVSFRSRARPGARSSFEKEIEAVESIEGIQVELNARGISTTFRSATFEGNTTNMRYYISTPGFESKPLTLQIQPTQTGLYTIGASLN